MAPTTPGGLRSPDELPQQAPTGAGPGPATLAGMRPTEEEGVPATPGPGTAMEQAISQLEKHMMELGQMTALFPAAVGPLREAARSIRAAIRQIKGNPGQPEPPRPNIGG